MREEKRVATTIKIHYHFTARVDFFLAAFGSESFTRATFLYAHSNLSCGLFCFFVDRLAYIISIRVYLGPDSQHLRPRKARRKQ